MIQTPGSNIPTFDGEKNLAGIRRWVEIETPSHDGAAVMARANFDMMTVFRLFSDGQNCNAGDRWQSKMASVGYDFGAQGAVHT